MGMRGPGAARQRKAAEAWQDDATAHAWEVPGLTRAGRVIAFLESLQVTKGFGAGEPLRLLPFQREWIEAVYQDGDDGQRAVRTALLSVARGNGKSVTVAGLALAHLIGPESEPRGECYSAAVAKEQASLIFAEMEAFIMAAPWMAARLNVKRFHKMIEDLETGSIYRALASDGPAAHGLAASFVACDELAQWKRRELFDVLRTSMGKRAAPLLVAIGTQSSKPDNIMSELVDYAGRVTSGEIDDRAFHGALYAIPDDLDAYDPANWHLANPALGVFRSEAEMRSEADRARRMPTFEPAFMNLYCNRRVDSEPKAINPAEWAAVGGAVDLDKLAGRPCYAGLDLGSTRDLCALVLYFPDDDGAVLPFFWCPKDNLAEREEVDRVPYRTWAKQGFIEATPGKAVDKRAIAHRIAQIVAAYDLQGMAFDRWGFADLQKILDGEGVRLPLVEWGQGFASMGPAIDAFETAMLSGAMRHGMHPVLRWNASNAVFETDPAGNRKPAKNRSIDRIDGLVALVMACGLAARHNTRAATYQGSGVSWA
jgi:phage terminase large subunit-like protein